MAGSMPPWLRQPNALNVPVSARPMYWPCSIGVIVAWISSPKISCHIEMISVFDSTLNGSFVVLNVNSMRVDAELGLARVELLGRGVRVVLRVARVLEVAEQPGPNGPLAFSVRPASRSSM